MASTTELTQCLLPGGVKLVWADRYWVNLMLPADSMKKKAARFFIRSGMTRPIETRFNGTLGLGDFPISIDSILSTAEFHSLGLEVKAAFANVQHTPPRIYVWLQGTSGWYFLKIGGTSDLPVFQNEVTFSKLVPQHRGRLLTHCVALVRGAEWTGLLSIGLSPEQLARRRRLSALEVLRSPLFCVPQRAGPFDGIVHCDLGSNNVYHLDGHIWIADWEMAGASAPDFCDAICLATVAAADRVDEHRLRAILKRVCGLSVGAAQLRSALRFLTRRGNLVAGRASVRLDSEEKL